MPDTTFASWLLLGSFGVFLVLSGILVFYEGFMNLFGLDKGDAGMDEKLSGGRCAPDA